MKVNVNVEGLVSDVYSIDYLKVVYVEYVLSFVELDSGYRLVDNVVLIIFNLLFIRRLLGRLRKKRFFSRGEVKVNEEVVTNYNLV